MNEKVNAFEAVKSGKNVGCSKTTKNTFDKEMKTKINEKKERKNEKLLY